MTKRFAEARAEYPRVVELNPAAPWAHAGLGLSYLVEGKFEEAVTLLEDTLQVVNRTGERWLKAELNRHKARVLLRQGHTKTAEELYRKALSIAEKQEAKLWELRAAVSPAQLRRDQGRQAEAWFAGCVRPTQDGDR